MEQKAFDLASDQTRDNWNQCVNIMIAYHMARIYNEKIGPAVKRACMAVSLRTKDRIIYDYCMRVIHSDDEAGIIESIGRLQQNFPRLRID